MVYLDYRFVYVKLPFMLWFAGYLMGEYFKTGSTGKKPRLGLPRPSLCPRCSARRCWSSNRLLKNYASRRNTRFFPENDLPLADPRAMIENKKVCVVLPAYNAARTLQATLDQIDRSIADEIIIVDDGSTDATRELVRQFGLKYAFHENNYGYGGNQKTCYTLALATGADIVVMLHPDYQYEPRLLPALAGMISSGIYDVAIASRILGKGALRGGMPLYKYAANRLLTFIQNILIGQKLSEYHSGYRAFTRQVLETLPLAANSDNFIFDNQILVQCHYWKFTMAEISCPTKYFAGASSINFFRSLRYGFGTLAVSLAYCTARMGLWTPNYLNLATAGRHKLSTDLIARRICDTNILYNKTPGH